MTSRSISPHICVGHIWSSIDGSNVSFVCTRCGIQGYLPAKEAELGIKSKRDCNDELVRAVLDNDRSEN